MDKKDVGLLLMVGGGASLAYGLSLPDDTSNLTGVPPGGSLSGWTNNTGGPVWVNTVGTVVDAVGNIVTEIQNFIPGSGGGDNASAF